VALAGHALSVVSCPLSIKMTMKTYTTVVEKDPETDLYVGWIPGFRGAHSQGETLDELNDNLREVVEMLLDDGKPR
jgi:predicted RNase H-like HicB family nuclease